MTVMSRSDRDNNIAVLDELVGIIFKFRQSPDILTGGDVNVSLHRSMINIRDDDFKNFLHENKLKIPTMCPVKNTFLSF